MASVLVVVAVCLLATVLYLMSRKKQKLAFPGPKGLPIIGCFFEMKGRRTHDLFLEWSAKYGGVFTYSLFGNQYLVVSSPEALHEALVTRGDDFAGRPFMFRFDVVTHSSQDSFPEKNLTLAKSLRQVAHRKCLRQGKGQSRRGTECHC